MKRAILFFIILTPFFCNLYGATNPTLAHIFLAAHDKNQTYCTNPNVPTCIEELQKSIHFLHAMQDLALLYKQDKYLSSPLKTILTRPYQPNSIIFLMTFLQEIFQNKKTSDGRPIITIKDRERRILHFAEYNIFIKHKILTSLQAL